MNTRQTEHGFGNHPKGWEPGLADVPSDAVGLPEMESLAKSRALRPTEADKRAAFGEPQQLPDGTMGWRVNLDDPKSRGKHFELTGPWRRLERQRCHEYNGRRKVAFTDRATGQQTHVFAEQAEHVARRRNLRELSRRTGSPVVAGPGGMLFRWLGRTMRWDATGRRCLGTPLDGSDPTVLETPQLDPDGNAWALFSGEWIRCSEEP